MLDVAIHAKAEIGTVDRVLNSLRKVRKETARRVLDPAENLGYWVSPVINHRLKQKTPAMKFGFMLPKEKQAFYRHFSAELQTAVNNCDLVRGESYFYYPRSQNASEYAYYLEHLGKNVDCVGASAMNNDRITRAVSNLSYMGI